MATAVEFESVSKRFIIHHERPRSFQELAVSFFKRNNASWEELWALKDVSFAVEGGLSMTVAGQTRPVRAGESYLAPANVEHGATAVKRTVVIDVFSPPREDYK